MTGVYLVVNFLDVEAQLLEHDREVDPNLLALIVGRIVEVFACIEQLEFLTFLLEEVELHLGAH